MCYNFDAYCWRNIRQCVRSVKVIFFKNGIIDARLKISRCRANKKVPSEEIRKALYYQYTALANSL